jgi:uncharacterized Zn finger protein
MQETRGKANRIWWAERWLKTIESMRIDGIRLGKGRVYAMSGQISKICIDRSHVECTVVGSRVDPYTISIDFRTPDEAAKKRIIKSLKSEPITIARLVAGDLPFEVEEAFRVEGLDFFPGGRIAPGKYDMTTKCSCPDYANPCKHVIAALFILGEEVARRPAFLLELRGIDIEELL